MKRVFFAIACFSLADLKNVECRAYCRFSAGYDSGVFSLKRKQCLCLDLIDDERLENKRIILPGKIGRSKSMGAFSEHRPESTGETVVPYRLPWED